MAQAAQKTTGQQNNKKQAVATVQQAVIAQKDTLMNLLPKGTNFDKFMITFMATVQKTPKLLEARREKLYLAIRECAADGLYPDGKEAALVPFKSKYGMEIQYLPMVAGVRRLMLRSGQVDSIVARCVYKGDEFEIAYGDDESIRHVPAMANRGPLIAAYCIVKMKSGEVIRETVHKDDIDKARKASRSGANGPWGEWYDEMARKTAIHRAFKYVPIDTQDGERIRQATLRGIEIEGDCAVLDASPQAGEGITAQLAQFAEDEPDPHQPSPQDATGEAKQQTSPPKGKAQPAANASEEGGSQGPDIPLLDPSDPSPSSDAPGPLPDDPAEAFDELRKRITSADSANAAEKVFADHQGWIDAHCNQDDRALLNADVESVHDRA